MGFALFGYDQGIMSGIINAPQFFRAFPDLDPAIVGATKSSTMQAFYTAIYEIGCLAGAAFALMFGNRMGRRRNMLLGASIMVIGVLIQITTIKGHKAGYQFVIGRIITGVGNGLNTATIPTWQAECSKSHNRGLLICIEASTIAFGTVIAYWIDFGLSYVDNSVSWRVPIALQMIFAVCLVIGVLLLPESPRWLISQGFDDEGQRVVAALAASPYDSEKTLLETRVIHETLAAMEGTQKTGDLLTNGKTQHFRRMLLGASSQFFQQIGGCNAVIYFAPVIYENYIGLDHQLSLILGGVNATVYALSAFFSYPMVETVGRRNMFLWGSVGQAGSMFLASFCLIPYNLGGDTENKVLYGAVVGLFLFLISFGCTWLELPWLYPAEISPLRTRTQANAVSTMTNWLWNFSVVMWTPPMLNSIGGFGTFLFFGIINVLFVPIIYVFYPETKGRSLEELDVIFAKAYTTKEWYVKTAHELPALSMAEVETEAQRWGISGEVASDKAAMRDMEEGSTGGSSEPSNGTAPATVAS